MEGTAQDDGILRFTTRKLALRKTWSPKQEFQQ